MFHWRPRIQYTGLGAVLVSGFAPEMGVHVPYIFKEIGFTAGLVMMIWPVLEWAEDRTSSASRKSQLMIYIIGCILGGLILVYSVRGIVQGGGRLATDPRNADLDFTIKLRCDKYMISASNIETGDSYYYYIAATPRPEMDPHDVWSAQRAMVGVAKRTTDIKAGNTVRCVFRNEGDKIITNVQVAFKIDWRIDNVTDPSSPRGANVAPADFISPPLSLGISDTTREAYFYLINASDSFIYFNPEDIASVKIAGSDDSLTAKLITGNVMSNRHLLWPGRHLTSSPDASRPVPAPPGSLAGK